MRLERFAAALFIVVLAAVPSQGIDDTIAPKARLAVIEAAQKVAFDRFASEISKAEKTEESREMILEGYYEELQKYVEAAFSLARAHPADPAAFEALKFIIRKNRAGPGDGTARALRMILERGDVRTVPQGNYLAQVALPLFQYPDAEKVLQRVLDENPSRADRAQACYWLAQHLRQQGRMVRRLRKKPSDMKDYAKYTAAQPIAQVIHEKDPEALDKASDALLERVVAEFGDVQSDGEPRTLGVIASGELFAMRNLAIGMLAPAVEGTDHEGKRFKLSDFRGRVVVMTFSGNWCGPCRGMYPQERELTRKLKDKPFVMVSVDTDEDIATLKQAITSGEITWRCWFDGGTDGPITTRWGVSSFPSVFVLDPSGVIRFKDVRGEDLDRAVATLLAETIAGRTDVR